MQYLFVVSFVRFSIFYCFGCDVNSSLHWYVWWLWFCWCSLCILFVLFGLKREVLAITNLQIHRAVYLVHKAMLIIFQYMSFLPAQLLCDHTCSHNFTIHVNVVSMKNNYFITCAYPILIKQWVFCFLYVLYLAHILICKYMEYRCFVHLHSSNVL